MAEWPIRAAMPEDAEAILALWASAGGRPSATDDEAGISALLARDPGSLLLSDPEGRPAGTLIAAWDGWRGSFYRLAVDPGWRRRGLATALVRAGERRLEGLGARRLTAVVAEEEPAAGELWEALGYERQASTGRFVRMVA